MAMLTASKYIYITTGDLVIIPFSREVSLHTTVSVGLTGEHIRVPSAIFQSVPIIPNRRDYSEWLCRPTHFNWHEDGEFDRIQILKQIASRETIVLPIPQSLRQMFNSLMDDIY